MDMAPPGPDLAETPTQAMVAQAGSRASQRPGDASWRITGNRRVDDETIARYVEEHSPGSVDELRQVILNAYQNEGVMSAYVQINEVDRVMHVVEADSDPRGKYGSFLPNGRVLTQDMLHDATPLMEEHARNHNETIELSRGDFNPDRDTLQIYAEGSGEELNPVEVDFTAHTMGSENAGMDIGSLRVTGYGGGFRGHAEYSHGFADLRNESKGGGYNAGALGGEFSAPIGIFGIEGRHSRYTQGGDLAEREISGNTSRAKAYWRLPVTRHWTTRLEVGYTDQEANFEEFDLGFTTVGFSDELHYYYAGGRVEYRTDAWLPGVVRTAARVRQGLRGEREEQEAQLPLLGAFDETFQVFGAELSWDTPIAWGLGSLHTHAQGQYADVGVPGDERFMIGGMDRGNSELAGLASGPKGGAGRVEYRTPAWRPGPVSIQPFTNVNGGWVEDNVESEWWIASAEAGLRFGISDTVNAYVGYAQTLNASRQTEPDPDAADDDARRRVVDDEQERINAYLNISF